MKGTKTPFKNKFLVKKGLNNLLLKIMFLEYFPCSIKHIALLHSSAKLFLLKVTLVISQLAAVFLSYHQKHNKATTKPENTRNSQSFFFFNKNFYCRHFVIIKELFVVREYCTALSRCRQYVEVKFLCAASLVLHDVRIKNTAFHLQKIGLLKIFTPLMSHCGVGFFLFP